MPDPEFRVTHLADAADRLGLGAGAGGSLPTWLGDRGGMAIGRACTIRQRALAAPQADAPLRHPEVVTSIAQPGEVIVIAVEGETVGATWGEAHTLRSIARGLAGVLIDGCTRDRDALAERGFPVLCRGASPFRSIGRLATAEVGGSVQIMGVEIRQGDTVAIDADGFIRIRAEDTEAVFALAREIAQREAQRDRQLTADLPTPARTPT